MLSNAILTAVASYMKDASAYVYLGISGESPGSGFTLTFFMKQEDMSSYVIYSFDEFIRIYIYIYIYRYKRILVTSTLPQVNEFSASVRGVIRRKHLLLCHKEQFLSAL